LRFQLLDRQRERHRERVSMDDCARALPKGLGATGIGTGLPVLRVAILVLLVMLWTVNGKQALFRTIRRSYNARGASSRRAARYVKVALAGTACITPRDS
jgi:hypothetical protein